MTVQPHEVFFKRPAVEYTTKADFDKAIAEIDQKMKTLDDGIKACMKIINALVENAPQAEETLIGTPVVLAENEVQVKNKKNK